MAMVVQRRGRRRGVVAAVVSGLVVGLLTTGCSEMGAAADERGSVDEATAVAVVHRAADVLARSGSSRARTSMETATGGTRLTIRGRGAFDYAERIGRLVVVLPQDAAGGEEHQPVTELLAPGALYMKDRGAGVPADKWVRVDTTRSCRRESRHRRGHRPALRGRTAARGRDVTYVGRRRRRRTA